MSDSQEQEPNKQALYGEFQRSRRWRDRLSKKLAHKALDIADDDMVINQHRSGFGWRELAVIGAALLGGGWLSGLLPGRAPPPAAEPAPAAVQPAAELEPIEGRIRFWVEDTAPARGGQDLQD